MATKNHKLPKKHLRHHVDKRLRRRFYLFLLIAVIMLGVIVFDIIAGKIDVSLALVGLFIGGIVGIVTSRMYHISWDHDANKVVSQFDKVGIILLILYILFETQRPWIASLFAQGPMLGSASFAILAGSMIGRVLGTRGKILQVLKEQQILT